MRTILLLLGIAGLLASCADDMKNWGGDDPLDGYAPMKQGPVLKAESGGM